MPRQTKASKMNALLNSFPVHRTVGLEIEGYMRDYPENVQIRHSSIKHDGSLRNAWWQDRNRPYGVEIVTVPLSNLARLDETWEDIKSHRWNAGRGSAGLHIHVDSSDFTLKDKLKAVYFGKRIENVMFLFVKPYRYQSRYCHLLGTGWLRLFDVIPPNQTIWNVFRNVSAVFDHFNISSSIANPSRPEYLNATTDRYNWLNAFGTRYPTIEFRLFNAISNEIQGKQFAILAHNFIETVKNCTFEQLQFIASSIDAEPDISTKGKMLLESLNIPFELPILGTNAAQAIHREQTIAQRQRVHERRAVGI